VITNLTGVLGPNDFTPSRMGAVFLALARRRIPALVAGGFDWVDVRDATAGMMAAEARGRTGENYLLAGHRHSIVALAALAEQATGVRAPRVAAPMWLARATSPAGLWWAHWRRTQPLFTPESLHALWTDPTVSSAKATRELGYEPRPTQETVSDVYGWFREAGMLPAGFPLRA
jgi:dihydroflavonol-4-reductase